MALEIGGAMLEPGVKGIWKAGAFIYRGLSGSDCKQLEEIVNSLLPVVNEICEESSSGSLPNSSLQKFPEFRNKIAEGNQLVEEHKTSRNPVRRIKINEAVKKLDKSINKFIQNDLQIVMALAQAHLLSKLDTVRALQQVMHVSLSAQLGTVCEGVEAVRERMETMREEVETVRVRVETLRDGVENVRDGVETGVQTLRQALETEVQSLHEALETGVQTLREAVETVHQEVTKQQIERSQQDESFFGPPDTPNGFLGFDEHIEEMRKLFLEKRMNVVGVTAMGGAGKSTLAKAVCKDDKIKEYFKERVIYIVVSQNPDLLSILKTMWKKIVDCSEPHFTNVEDAHDKLELKIKSIKEPTLVVLDDIWSKFHLERLLFEGEQYTTLVTTRDINVIPQGPKRDVYKLPLLQPEHALSLFCHCAFGKPTIPTDKDKEMVQQVLQACNRLPLALKVIGSSLYGKSDFFWKRAKKSLSMGEPFKDDHKERLLNILKTSIDVLEDKEKQCFLDLGAFPQRKSIPAKALLDIWV